MTERKTIRQLRQERGWTQEQLARRLGVNQSAISAWELGQRVPRLRYQQALTDLFGVSVEAIAYGPDEPPRQDRP